MQRWSISILICVVAMALVAPAALAKKKKKDEAPKIEPNSWFDYHGVQCYNPPDYAVEENEPNRRMLRQHAMEALMSQMRGEINEQFVIDERKIDAWETDFLGKPTGVEGFSTDNLAQCKKYAEGELGLSDYMTWFAAGGKRATAGDCRNPLAYELHQTLSVQESWQVRRHICIGDQVLIETTASNKYTVADTGDYETTPWITPAGDPEQPEAGEGFPCPHCPVGAVIYRFEPEDKSQPAVIEVLGASLEYKSENNGYISFTINDVTYYDNTFHESNGVIDYLPLSIYPPVMGIDDGG